MQLPIKLLSLFDFNSYSAYENHYLYKYKQFYKACVV